MTRRTGVPSLIDVASELCRLVSKYGTIIITLYPESTALHAALAAATAACSELEEELQKVRETGD